MYSVHKLLFCTFCNLVCLCFAIHCMHQRMYEQCSLNTTLADEKFFIILFFVILFVVFIYKLSTACSRECVNMTLAKQICHHIVCRHIVCCLFVVFIYKLFIVCSRECVNMTLRTHICLHHIVCHHLVCLHHIVSYLFVVFIYSPLYAAGSV